MPRNSSILLAATLAITMAISGCALLGPLEPPPATAPEKEQVPQVATEPSPEDAALHDVAWLMDYYRHISALSSKSLESEYRHARQAMNDHPSPRYQLRLAMLVATPGTRYHNRARAAGWLQDIISDEEQNGTIRDFALILLDSLDQQQQARSKLTTLNERIKELQSDNQTLQEQLDALKAIEKSLYERDKIEVTTQK